MYSRFLKEAMEITRNSTLGRVAEIFYGAGKRFTEIGLIFKDAETMSNLDEKIEIASQKFNQLADIEENAYSIALEASLESQ
jgi:predicted secreted protein